MALYAFLSPMVLARALDTKSYSAYVLGLQLVPFLLLLATPVQASIAPKFAKYRMIGLDASADITSLIALAANFFILIAFIAGAAAVSFSYILPVFLAWDSEFAIVASQAILYMGLATAFSMLAMVYTSYASGNQNFLWENIFKCLGPYLGLILVFIAWQATSLQSGSLSVQWVVGLSASSTLLGSIILISLGLKLKFKSKIKWFSVTPNSMRELLKDSGGAYWWQICALLSVGTGPFMVSKVDLESVSAYAIAVSAMSVIAGVSTAFSGPFTIQIAQASSKNQFETANEFLRFHSRFLLFILLSTMIVAVIPQLFFNFWLGEKIGLKVGQLMMPLAFANFLRQITSPYTAAVLGLGQQSKIWMSPAVEAVLSIILGITLGQAYGSQGVAYGLLLAAMVRLIITIFHDLKITRPVLPLSPMHLLFPRVVKSFDHSKI